MFKENKFNCEPPLNRDLLHILKYTTLCRDHIGYEDELYYKIDEEIPEIIVYDEFGNLAKLEYGDNGYITTGFRLDSQCNDWDSRCYPIFLAAEKLGGQIISCDGGKTTGYEEWKRGVKHWFLK